ncbi:carbon monoxide dehydrogenase [Pseudohoeflea suaedae]|uniref:Carbon monoxide dehydrogenase n=1 Tax=Pseudohoeflea suaedae TaxID=877384 RepID=A0A4R5PIV8_9HYPH|nr:FAD binding domain-containing protein [Pseudohoeflea suaedae]TDH35179.1 carbon monoxide dehydrogenase [Pseudohoeflea suaedae]
MKPVNFDYARPKDVAGVISLIGDESRVVKILAGGQSLGPMLNMRLVQPDLVVDITGIEELRQVEDRADEVGIGGCVTHSDIEDLRVADVTRGALPKVAAGIAYRAVRNRGTIGGSITHADPSADWISILSAIGATVTLRGPDGVRSLAVEDYMLGALEADLRLGELLVSVNVPKLGPAARWGYYKSCRKTGEFAHAIGAFLIDPDRDVCRAVFGATESKPLVVSEAGDLIGRTGERDLAQGFDSRRADELIRDNGMNDPIDRQIHVAALRRALEQSGTV